MAGPKRQMFEQAAEDLCRYNFSLQELRFMNINTYVSYRTAACIEMLGDRGCSFLDCGGQNLTGC